MDFLLTAQFFALGCGAGCLKTLNNKKNDTRKEILVGTGLNSVFGTALGMFAYGIIELIPIIQKQAYLFAQAITMTFSALGYKKSGEIAEKGFTGLVNKLFNRVNNEIGKKK